MMDVPATLSAAQLRQVELALAGLDDGQLRLEFTGIDVTDGDTAVLHDEEGTDVAEIAEITVEHVDPPRDEITQLGSGQAPPLPTIAVVTGAAAARRPLGHRDRADLRVARGSARTPHAVLITGTVPAPDDEGWQQHPGDAIVLDRGDSAALARAVTAVEAAGRRAVILPHTTDSDDENARIATQLVADDVSVWQTPRAASPGRVVLLTGLSGSGKSTISKLLVQRLAETDPRTTTLLDGDEVRQILSKGLGFSLHDRMLNVQRIGWVGALAARHGGIAVCAPIAPFEAMRIEMRRRVEEVGRFLLVHVSTPLEVCEERDRKGLYAKARAGEIPAFTGISDPYEIPPRPDLTIDASVVSPDDAVDRILAALAELDAR